MRNLLTVGASGPKDNQALTADFSARDDPAQRAQIGRDKQKAFDEQNRLKTVIVNDRKAISDLEDEARKAGVPAGWLRS